MQVTRTPLPCFFSCPRRWCVSPEPWVSSHSGSNCVRAPTVGSTLGNSRTQSAMSHAWLLGDGAGMVSDKTLRRRFGKDLEGEPSKPPSIQMKAAGVCGGAGAVCSGSVATHTCLQRLHTRLMKLSSRDIFTRDLQVDIYTRVSVLISAHLHTLR